MGLGRGGLLRLLCVDVREMALSRSVGRLTGLLTLHVVLEQGLCQLDTLSECYPWSARLLGTAW